MVVTIGENGVSQEVREIHARTASVVLSGLVINYPLQILVLYILIDLFSVLEPFWIATYSTLIMTVFAYTRVYIVNRFFTKRRKKI